MIVETATSSCPKPLREPLRENPRISPSQLQAQLQETPGMLAELFPEGRGDGPKATPSRGQSQDNSVSGRQIGSAKSNVKTVVPTVRWQQVGGPELVLRCMECKVPAIECYRGIFREHEAQRVASALEESTSLTHLALRWCRMKASGSSHIVRALSQNRTLVYLVLDGNSLGPQGGELLAQALRTNSALRHLSVAGTELGPDGAIAIADALPLNRGLQHLDMNRNGLQERGGRALALAAPFTSLCSLSVADNDLSAEVEACIAHGVGCRFGQLTLAEMLVVARKAALPKALLKDTAMFLERAAMSRPEVEQADFVAALQAQLVFDVDAKGWPGFIPTLLGQLSEVYVPNVHVSLPRCTSPVGCFLLNLTPFHAKLFSSAGRLAGTCARRSGGTLPGILPLVTESSLSVDVFLEVPYEETDELAEWLPCVPGAVHIEQTVGEQRLVLEAAGGEKLGELRVMLSAKDVAVDDGLIGNTVQAAWLLVVVWSPPTVLRGIRLADLKAYVASYREPSARQSRRPLEEAANMYRLVEVAVRPDTAASQSSLAEVFDFGPVDTFVSHYWGSVVSHTLLCLEKHAGGDEALRIWLCSMVNNQRRIAEELGKDIDRSPFARALNCRSCRAAALILDTDGAPLKRFWCLYEIMTIIQLMRSDKGMMFDLCTPQGVVNRGDVPPSFAIKIGAVVAAIDVQHAGCSNENDRVMIEQAICERLGGYESMNRTIREEVGKGLKVVQCRQDAEFDQVNRDLGLGSPQLSERSTLGTPQLSQRSMLDRRSLRRDTSRSIQRELEQLRLEKMDALTQRDALAASNQRLKDAIVELSVRFGFAAEEYISNP